VRLFENVINITITPWGQQKPFLITPYLWICILLCYCVCVCVCVREREREHERKKGRIILLSENRGETCLTWTALNSTCDDKVILLLTTVTHLHSD